MTFANILSCVLFICGLIFVVFYCRRARRLESVQQHLSMGVQHPWQRIFVARPEYFKKRFFKIFPCEARGILVFEPKEVCVKAVFPDGQEIAQHFPRGAEGVRWLGNRTLASANLHWFSLGDDALYLSADTGLTNPLSRRATSDLYRQIVGEAHAQDAPNKDFALESNPYSLSALLVSLALIAFAIIDGLFINQHTTIKTSTNSGIGPAAIFCFEVLPFAVILLLYRVLTRAKVPAREALVLGLFMALAVLAAASPAAKRLDQWLATTPEHVVSYRLEQGGHLVALDGHAPPLYFPDCPEYWAQFKLGSIHPFPMRRGALGIWQLNPTEFNRKVAIFYQRHSTPNRQVK